MPLGAFNSSAFTNSSGVQVAANADVEVRRESDGALASLFSNAAGSAPLTNPFTADAQGRFQLFAAGLPDGYQVKVTKNADVHTLRNVQIGKAGYYDPDSVLRAAMGFAPATDGYLQIGDGTNFVAVPPQGGFTLLNGYVDYAVAANALTISIKSFDGSTPSATKPVYALVRSATPGTPGLTLRKISAATSLVVSSGSTLGTVNSEAFRLWIVLFDDAGVLRLGVINCLSGVNIFPLAGWGIAGSTAEGAAGAADSAQVFYTSTAVSAKAYAVLGYATWETGLATAGTWSAGPTRAQLWGAEVPLPGATVQVQRSPTGAVATGTTTIPFDDTIPQITEGDQYMTQAITPTSAANLLAMEAQGHFASSIATSVIQMALFEDAVANALASVIIARNPAAGDMCGGQLKHTKLAGTTSSTTKRIRAGTSGAGTTTFNGSAGARIHGGVLCSHLQIAEVMT